MVTVPVVCGAGRARPLKTEPSSPACEFYSADDAVNHLAPRWPAKGELPNDVIADFRKWILSGAPSPREVKISNDVRAVIDIEQGLALVGDA